ncbi:MAG: TetR/AcrR family transcriptional regulator [Acidobacteria bacterium]|nr:TetR/AcrR family transcriptional regulator [Acidobacteriota bacterium]
MTRGSFYWHFRDRKELHDALPESWEVTSATSFERLLDGEERGIEEFTALCELWLEERALNPAWDSAMRDWPRSSPQAARVVRRLDNRRIELIQRIFIDLGYDEPEAFVRARVTYFHQVGYYALGLGETKARRRELLPLYVRVLTGVTPSRKD